MKLSEAKRLFAELRQGPVIVKRHAYRDHPERKFTPTELVNLVKSASGRLRNNTMPSAISGSFLWCCHDEDGRPCELAILFEEAEVGTEKKIVIVCHAFR